MLANRILNYVPGAVRDLLKQLHLEAFERSSFGGNTTVVEYDKSRLFGVSYGVSTFYQFTWH